MRTLAFLPLLLAGTCVSFARGCTIYRASDVDSQGVGRQKRDLSSNCGPDDPIPPNRVDTTQRLADLRAEMAKEGVQAYYVPLDEEARRKWISGFSGSNGDAIVTLDKASCWTDGRYFLQAADQLDCNWELMRMSQPGVPTYSEWLTGEGSGLKPGDKVAADPTLIGAKTWLDLSKDLEEAGIELVSMADNLIDRVWTAEQDGRPEILPKDIVVHPLSFAGKSYEEKLADLRADLAAEGFSSMVISEHDEIAWLFNLRGEGGSILEGLFYSPLFASMALVTQDEVYLWIHMEKSSPELLAHLQAPGCDQNNSCVQLGDITQAISELSSLASKLDDSSKVMITLPSTYLTGASYAVYEAIPEVNSDFADSPVLDRKAVKNEIEKEGMINSHIRDAYAVVEFAAFMENEIKSNPGKLWTEISAAEKLSELRAKQVDAKGDSFETISASGSNAAVIHYAPAEETNAAINDSAVFLLDSGGQYMDGTTDITRTFYYGPNPPEEVVEMYTRVLMGAIDLARVVVPAGTTDNQVDLATRQHLFQKGLDFRHGTGHGIGSYLKVHEGPTRIGMSKCSQGKLLPNFFFSDEPGYYKDGEYGIRLESILRVVEKDFPQETFGKFIGFEAVTLVPFEPNLIDYSLMTPDQIVWLNEYNDLVMEKVTPHFQEVGDLQSLTWLIARTEYVSPARSHLVADWREEL